MDDKDPGFLNLGANRFSAKLSDFNINTNPLIQSTSQRSCSNSEHEGDPSANVQSAQYQNLGHHSSLDQKGSKMNSDNPNQPIPQIDGITHQRGLLSNAKVQNIEQPSPEAIQTSGQQEGYNSRNISKASTGDSFALLQQGAGASSSKDASNNSHQYKNLGGSEVDEFNAHSGTKGSEYKSKNMNFDYKPDQQYAEEEKVFASPDERSRRTASSISSSELSRESIFKEEFKKCIKSQLEILLDELDPGCSLKDILSDRVISEEKLKLFEKCPQRKRGALAINLAGFHLACNNLESAKAILKRINNPDLTDENLENASHHRAYYIMQANLKINENDFKKSREYLKKCWTIQQKHFSDGKENYLDFYATSMGRIHLKEGSLKEAEKCFNDALALRLFSKNSRLISSSYSDLALLYIQKANKTGPIQADREKALQYRNKAFDYDRIFDEELKSNTYNVLLGPLDFKSPNLTNT